jgi:hypothetical protein
MEETETETLNHGGTECKQLSSEMAHAAPSFPKAVVEFARTESDPTLIKKKFFEITGEQATLQDVAELKAHIAKEQRDMSLASFSGDLNDYHKRAVVDQFEIVNYLKSRVMTGDDEALKFYDKNVGVLERMVNQKADTQNNVQVNFNVNEVLEAINGT